MLKLVGIALLVLGTLPLVPAVAAGEALTADLPLQQLPPKDALTILRSLTGAGDLKIVDEHTLRVTGAAETVELVKAVLDAAEHPSNVSDAKPTRELADGSVVASIRLQHAPIRDVFRALLNEGKIHKLGMCPDVSTVMLRDTAEQVDSALALIRRMDVPQK